MAGGTEAMDRPGIGSAVTSATVARQLRSPSITFHGLRHSFVAILVAAGCNVREVSEWAGHNSVAFTLTRYGSLFEDGSEAAVDRWTRCWEAARRTQTTYLRWTRAN
jgi:integrase